eukprot:m.309992 g.309992  ORF g.309992 m.309992 type:complete len:276 (+) comp49036_c0_seq1:248-1075(+)
MSVFRPGLFAGKVAIVTGGGTGIGRSIATELLHLGCKVVIASRNAERLKAAAEEMKEEGDVTAISCNVRKEEQVKSLIETTLSTYGKVDFMVNNGGGQFISPAENISLKGWNAVIETNLHGTFLCCREAHNQWMKQNGGSIVNMAMNFWQGHPGFVHSSAARAGIDNLTKTLAVEWAASGIRVNCIAPGNVYSDTAAANYTPGLLQSMRTQSPAMRLGTTEEVAGVTCFLLSPASSYVSGITVKIDGGTSLYGSYFTVPDHNKLPVYAWQEKAKL